MPHEIALCKLYTQMPPIVVCPFHSRNRNFCTAPYISIWTFSSDDDKILLFISIFQHLKALRFKYNSLSSEDFISLCPELQRFTNITALDLSCNCINVYQNNSACDALSDLLGKLPDLRRLDLSNNRIKSKVRRLLSNIQKPLEYLRLVGCGLMTNDIAYLAVSHHTQALQELDLSENNLGLSIQQIASLLKAVRTKILVLELEECELIDTHFLMLSSSCLKELTGLMYLNISGNFLSREVIESVCQSVVSLPELQWLVMAYATECYVFEDDELEERLKLQFKERVKEILSGQRRSLDSVPSIFIKELEQTM